MLTWFFLLLFLAIALVAGGLAARSFMTGEPIVGNFFGPKPEKRLGVVEQTSVDNRRKLLLVRRDGVEHLILTGGPVDVVIETGIGAAPQRALQKTDGEPTASVFQRQPRTLGQVVNE
jgi:flagellar protein FliO/FliZ